jgi:hypothetical protein
MSEPYDGISASPREGYVMLYYPSICMLVGFLVGVWTAQRCSAGKSIFPQLPQKPAKVEEPKHNPEVKP